MNNAKSYIYLVVVLVLVFVVGIVIGFFYNVFSSVEKQTTKSLSSHLISSITAKGIVENIDGKIITIKKGTEKISFALAEGADINIISLSGSNTGTYTVSQPSDNVGAESISIGSNISTILKLLPSGELEAVSISVLLTGE